MKIQLNKTMWVLNISIIMAVSANAVCRYSNENGDSLTLVDQTVKDGITGLIWQRMQVNTTMRGDLASNYCNSVYLNGFSFRLPTIRELSSLIDFTLYNPCINSNAFPNTTLGLFWSSTGYQSNPGACWYVNFVNGARGSSGCTAPSYIRCVRSNNSTSVATAQLPTTAIPSTQAPTTLTPSTAVPTTAAPSSTPLTYTCTGGTTTPPTNGLLAAWNASSGVYADATNQINRYNISNWTALDTLTGIIWEQNVSPTTMNFTQAQSYCAGRNTGGLSGWRVPNIVELNTMWDYTLLTPFVNTVVFPGTTAVTFWSMSPHIGNPGSAWDLQLGSATSVHPVTTMNMVRCVIACYQIPPGIRYVNSSGEVTDLVTGLVWQQYSPPSPSTYNRSAAIVYCSNFTINNHSWRLPTIRELQTLVDYNVSNGLLVMNSTLFRSEPYNGFWSASRVAGGLTFGWYLYFSGGSINFDFVSTGGLHLRCVRSP